MHSILHLAKFVRRLAAGALLLPLLMSSLTAQTAATGGISGRVYDQATGRSLQGAVVRIAGTNASDFTDAEGRFTIPAVRPGPATVEIEYVGLDSMAQSITVSAGAVATIDAGLKSTVLQLATFEVKEAARGQALAINLQKTASGIINIVSEETFGTMYDGNIGYALQRLPGITVDQDEDGAPQGANIRGLPPEFNSFQIDGNRVGSRSFNPRNLAADGIATIEVIKAPTPDRDGDAIGGIINVVSRSAFQRDGREFKLSGSGTYLELPQKWGYNVKATYSDLYSLFGKEKNLGVSLTASKYRTNRYYDNNDTDYSILTRATNPTYNLPTERMYYTSNQTVQYNLRATDTYGLGAVIDFRANEHNSFYLKPLFSHYTMDSMRVRGRHFPDTRHQDAATGRKTLAVVTPELSRSGPLSVGEYRYQGEQSDTENDLRSISFGGKHELGSATLTYDLFHSYFHYARDNDSAYIIRNTGPAGVGFMMEVDHRKRMYPKVNILSGDPRNLSTITRGDLQMAPEWTKTRDYSAKTDWEKQFVGEKASSKLKFGAKFRSSEPQRERTQFSYRTDSQLPYAQFMTPTNRVIHQRQLYMDIDMDKVYALLRSSPQLFVLQAVPAATGSANADYKAKEETTAAYGMYSAQIGRHTILGGLRMEQNQWSAQRKRLNLATFRVEPISNGSDYAMWLPGIHFRHELRKNLILRESYNRSYGRPNLNNLTAGRTVDALGNISDGNPELAPTTSENFDAQLEFYTANGGLYSAGVFYKEMKGFYYSLVRRFDAVDANDNPTFVPNGAFTHTQPQNADGGTNYGVELIARQKLRFLPKPFNGLGVSLSGTFTESEAKYPSRPNDKLPTFGFSKGMFNAAIEYAAGRFRGEVSYRYRTAYLSSLGTDVETDDINGAREQVDAEASFRLTKGLRLFAQGENLTKRPMVTYQGYAYFPEDTTQYSWRATIGAEWSF